MCFNYTIQAVLLQKRSGAPAPYEARNAIMPKRPTVYHRPHSLEEALRLLEKPDLFALGGGTSLLAGDVSGGVVDLQGLGLDKISWPENDGRFLLQAGATTRLTDLAAALAATAVATGATPPPEPGRRHGPQQLLADAIYRAGPNTFRNVATVGGVVATRPADSELLAVLLLLETELTLYFRGHDQANAMLLTDYLQAGERPPALITALTCRWHPGRGHSERVARTPADTPIVSIAAWQPAGQRIRLAATGLAERPFRLTAAESVIASDLDKAAIERAAVAVKAANRHPGDFRGDAAYRAEMGAILVRRVLQMLGE
jgi:CO/xanthine dehydrogenase FAD-binding subunit